MPEIPSPQRRPRRRLRRALIATATTVTLAAGGGTAWALDRFVIDHVEISDVAAYEAAQGVSDSTVSAAGGTVTRDTYTSDGASVTTSTVTYGSGEDTVTYYVLCGRVPASLVSRLTCSVGAGHRPTGGELGRNTAMSHLRRPPAALSLRTHVRGGPKRLAIAEIPPHSEVVA